MWLNILDQRRRQYLKTGESPHPNAEEELALFFASTAEGVGDGGGVLSFDPATEFVLPFQTHFKLFLFHTSGSFYINKKETSNHIFPSQCSFQIKKILPPEKRQRH